MRRRSLFRLLASRIHLVVSPFSLYAAVSLRQISTTLAMAFSIRSWMGTVLSSWRLTVTDVSSPVIMTVAWPATLLASVALALPKPSSET